MWYSKSQVSIAFLAVLVILSLIGFFYYKNESQNKNVQDAQEDLLKNLSNTLGQTDRTILSKDLATGSAQENKRGESRSFGGPPERPARSKNGEPSEGSGVSLLPNGPVLPATEKDTTVGSGAKEVTSNIKSGEIVSDETWSGEIKVTGDVSVKEGVTLVISPGTTVRFKHSRDYKRPNKLTLEVNGRLLAVGTPSLPIRFTSDAEEPQNGDWSMIRLFGKTRSQIKYAIIEFGQQGINMWQSDATISHSIVRFNNWEGIYAESYSNPVVEHNQVYQNGYNGMAMEQFNNAIIRFNVFEKSGTHGLHVDASEALVEGNILRENGAAGLSLDDAATVRAINNTISGNGITSIMCGEGENRLTGINNFLSDQNLEVTCFKGAFPSGFEGAGAQLIGFDLQDFGTGGLDYVPGDLQKDRYQYIYPTVDESRRVITKIGKGLGLTWSIAFDGKDIWTATVAGEIYKLEPTSGRVLKNLKAPSPQPWGMAFDGENIWITDFAEKRTYALDVETGEEISSFNNPDQLRGAKGLAYYNGNLFIMGWTTGIIYEVKQNGQLVHEIKLSDPGAGGGLTFDGVNFWVPCGNRICRYSSDGRLVGAIYAQSEGEWDLAWQESADNKFGGYLWVTQRTNENWQDEKIYKVEILNDQVAIGN